MIRLITATPGSGKTCLVIEWLLKEIDKGFYKSIYSNIEGLKIMGIHKLLDDWRNVPEEHKPCLYIVDEAQYFREFMKETTKDNPIGKDLSTHRHEAVDFWLITQSVKLLNSYVIENVGEHVHLYRPKKAKTVTVYWWSYAVTNMSKANFKSADDVQKWRLNPHMFDYYKSTVAVTDGKARISQRNVTSYITFVLIIIMIGFFVNKGLKAFEQSQHQTDSTMGVDHDKLPINEKEKTEQKAQADAAPLSDLVNECRKGENVDKPECKKWFDEMSKNGNSVSPAGEITAISYDSSKPYDFNPQPQIEVRDYPRLTGCARNLKGQYVGIDQQGNLMPQITQSDCKKWISGYRTFDYTKAPLDVKNNAVIPAETNNTQSAESTAQELAQMEEAKAQGLI